MSKKITVELYGHPGNNAVVRMPDRQNPGVVIKADTLGSLADDARVLANVIRANGLVHWLPMTPPRSLTACKRYLLAWRKRWPLLVKGSNVSLRK
jgi:hypothetical protein